jgi:hypothetical protein
MDIVPVCFGCRARCGSNLVSNTKTFGVRGNKIVHFLDLGTRRMNEQLYDQATLSVLKPLQVTVYRACVNPQCGQDEIMKTKVILLSGRKTTVIQCVIKPSNGLGLMHRMFTSYSILVPRLFLYTIF